MKKNLKRRDFIKKAGLAGAATAAVSAFPAPAMPAFLRKSRRLKFFFIFYSQVKIILIP